MIGIKGIEMPRCCSECRFIIFTLYEGPVCKFLNTIMPYPDRRVRRHVDCPLVEIAAEERGETNA